MTPNYEPYSDITISDEETITLHDSYIEQGKYTEAQAVIDNDDAMSNKGFQAAFPNQIENKLRELQIYLLNKVAAPDEYYSFTEPSIEFMEENGYLFWIKPI